MSPPRHPTRLGATYTAGEVDSKTAGYLQIAPELWTSIKFGTHIRYYTAAGEFKTGGLIKTANFTIADKGPAFKLQSTYNVSDRGHFEWAVPFSDVSRVLAKMDALEATLHQDLSNSVTVLDGNVRKIADYVKSLEARIAALEARRS